MPTEVINKYTVLRDTSEKSGWIFEPDDYCEKTEEFNLFTGDYTLKGYEKDFIIERKATTSEMAGNICEKRFKNELERLEEFKYPFLVCEFALEDLLMYPVNSGIPQRIWPRLKLKSKFLFGELMKYQFKYKTKIIYADSRGKDVAKQLFRWAQEYAKPR